MSLPLHDLGSVKVSEVAHSYLRARALSKRTDVTTLVRDLVEAHVPRRVELVAARLIRDSGRERNTAGGDAAVVWVATEYAGEGDS